jgi:deoxyribose-phosphate aldolase
MNYTKEQVAALIDHAVLKPFSTDDDVVAGARMCRERGIGCICVRPTDVKLACQELDGSDCLVASVVGFPHGIQCSKAKASEAEQALEDGVDEMDMVMNYGCFLSGDHDYVRKDIEAVVQVAKAKGVPVKVIFETCYLSLEQVAEACKLAEAAGASFVKTSTGFAEGGATPEVIDVMIKTVGDTMGVKASGGIRTWDDAVGYLDQGCARLGVGSTEAVLDGGTGSDSY